MFVKTLRPMINLLDQCPVDHPLRDTHGKHYSLRRTQREWNRLCLVMIETDEGHGSSTIDLLSTLITASFDYIISDEDDVEVISRINRPGEMTFKNTHLAMGYRLRPVLSLFEMRQ